MIDSELQPIRNFVLYTTPNGEVKLEVFIQDETLWLTQKAIANLLGVEVPAISKHLNNIYDSGELVKETTISILETVQLEVQFRCTRNDSKNPKVHKVLIEL